MVVYCHYQVSRTMHNGLGHTSLRPAGSAAGSYPARHPPAHVRCPARPRDNGRDPRCSRSPVCRVRSDAGQSVAMPRTAAGCHRHHPRMSAVSLRSWTVTPQGCFWTGMGSCRVGRRLPKTFCNTGIADAPDLGG